MRGERTIIVKRTHGGIKARGMETKDALLPVLRQVASVAIYTRRKTDNEGASASLGHFFRNHAHLPGLMQQTPKTLVADAPGGSFEHSSRNNEPLSNI